MTEPTHSSAPLTSSSGAELPGASSELQDGSEKPAAHSGKPAKPQARVDSVRETIESIAVAFILAFLFRTFVAEAFVIPTGSMATTLMGRHKDMRCPNCKYPSQASASDETNKDTGEVRRDRDGNYYHVEKTVCPNCGLPTDTSDMAEYPSYKGDRIVVSKLGSNEPRRWQVTVFRYPVQAGTNYIKRLVGLPGEVIKIQNGDLSARPVDDPSQPFRILRKPLEVVQAMLRDVYDNDYIVDWMTDAGWPPRWQPCPMDIASLVRAGWERGNRGPWTWPAAPQPGGWVTNDKYRSFEADGTAQEVWIRYQHFRPQEDTWREQLIYHAPAATVQSFFPEGRPNVRQKERQRLLAAQSNEPRPSLQPEALGINDFIGYNESLTNDHKGSGGAGQIWVGDLAVSCLVSPAASQGEVVLELVEAGRRFHCILDLGNRSVRLAADGGAVPFEDEAGQAVSGEPAAKDVLPQGKSFHVQFANIDSQLLVWIDGELIQFDRPTSYRLNVTQADGTPADNSPVGIASRGASVQVSHIKVMRDVYYTTQDEFNGDTFTLRKGATPEDDQFFVLGDNSAASLDARTWTPLHVPLKEPHQFVERKLLIGKALFIFWPHSWDSPVPFTPNWDRMRFIR